MHARTRSGAAQGKEPLRITAEDLTEGLSACAEEDRKHAERNEDLLRQHFPQVDNVVELAQQQLKCVLMLDLARHFELAALLRANSTSSGCVFHRSLIVETSATADSARLHSARTPSTPQRDSTHLSVGSAATALMHASCVSVTCGQSAVDSATTMHNARPGSTTGAAPRTRR